MTFLGEKPEHRANPLQLDTLSDHLKKRRLDLGLVQREVASQMGISKDTYRNWEAGRTSPTIGYWSRIIEFLGYDPNPSGDQLPERLKALRRRMGWSQEKLARAIGVDESTILRWETGQGNPSKARIGIVANIADAMKAS